MLRKSLIALYLGFLWSAISTIFVVAVASDFFPFTMGGMLENSERSIVFTVLFWVTSSLMFLCCTAILASYKLNSRSRLR